MDKELGRQNHFATPPLDLARWQTRPKAPYPDKGDGEMALVSFMLMEFLMHRPRFGPFLTLAAAIILLPAVAPAKDTKRDALWAAVRAGDAKAVAAALDNGADVNAKNE